jgi:hypothetical protein
MADAFGNFLEDPFGLVSFAKQAQGDIASGFNKAGILAQDVERNTLGTLDNTRADALYTIRDTKSEFLHTADSALDNLATVIHNIQNNVFDTLQYGTVFGFTGFLIFLVLFGDKVFNRPIKVGLLKAF